VHSLDAISANSETLSLIDMIADPKSLIDMNELSISHQAEEMLELIDKYLDDRSKFVIRSRRLQEPLTWAEIAAKLGVAPSRVQQIERMALFQPLNISVTYGEYALMGYVKNTSKNGRQRCFIIR
jgi:DNA-directed RNA polymerase sigma subunit (sigma70/sigma32)